MSKKTVGGARLVQARLTYVVELARGSSHIASSQTPASLHRAIAEVIDEFRRIHGPDALDVFQELLAQATERRAHREAAGAVRNFRLV